MGSPPIRLLLFFNLFIFSVLSETRDTMFARFDFNILKASTIEEKKVESGLDCGLPCARHEQCRSFNVAIVPDPDDGTLVCQLLNTDVEMAPQLLVHSEHFHHFSRIRPPCERAQCYNGGICVENSNYQGTGYSCECQQGFMGMNCEKVKWIKFNSSPVTFGAKDDQYGAFNITQDGFIFTIKLVYLGGYVTIIKSVSLTRSHWYSNNEITGAPLSKLGIIITDASRIRVLPLAKDMDVRTNLYGIPGYNSMSPELVFKNFTTPYKVHVGQQLQIWYFQDWKDFWEHTNEGTVQVDVYGWYV